MPRPGGEADKLGNRYEGLWVVDAALDLIDGEFGELVFEAVGDEAAGVEFYRTKDSGVREYHSIKRQQADGNWTVSRLTRADADTSRSILGDIIEKVRGGAYAVFSSGTSATELEELIERSRSSDSIKEFQRRISGNGQLSRRFLDRIVPICDDEETAYIVLRRIQVRTKNEPELTRDVERRIRSMFRKSNGEPTDAKSVRLLMTDFATHRMGTSLSADSFLANLSDHGFMRSPLAGDAAVSQRDEYGDQHLDAEALLLGPVEALDLTSKVEEAQRLATESPEDAAGLYEEIAAALRKRFPGQADQFDQLRAKALRDAGCAEASHDLLVELAVREVYERARPQLSPRVARSLEELRNDVDEVREARGGALIHFGRCHEYSGEIQRLAECFDILGPADKYAPVIATLLVEAALAYHAFQIVHDRKEVLLSVEADGAAPIGLRLRAALGDAGISDIWPELIHKAKALRFPPSEGTFVCLRGARWCSWSGQLVEAELLYRLAMKLGADADLDLDVENALWSLTVLHSLGYSLREAFETNRMALSMEGSRSYLMQNTRTQRRSYMYLANGELPNAHLWTRFRLLESIRSGCLMAELESHAILSRIYDQSCEPLDAVKHAILGDAQKLIKELASKVSEWPEYIVDMVRSEAPWVRKSACQSLEHVGDLAPPQIARELSSELVHWLHNDLDYVGMAPSVLKALGEIVLDASDDDIQQLMPVLERLAVREPDKYRLTDPGMLTLAARLYRFRPAFKKPVAAIFAEMANGSHTGDWTRALQECGDDTGELIKAFQQVAERDGLNLAGSLEVLGHVTASTRAKWSQRIRYVDEYALGKRSGGPIGPHFGVPADFLREQDAEVISKYVDKLVMIGCDDGELALNRRSALAAAANAIDVLQRDDKRRIFGRVWPLVEQPIQISEMDRFDASTQHPLSRFRISFGSAADVRTSAGWLLARSATGPDECTVTMQIALNWVRSDDTALQKTGASMLTLPNLTLSDVPASEMAQHTNPSVRGAAVWLPNVQESQEATVLEQLASDPDRSVRIAVAQALPLGHSMDPEGHARIRACLIADPSAIVRACASMSVKH